MFRSTTTTHRLFTWSVVHLVREEIVSNFGFAHCCLEVPPPLVDDLRYARLAQAVQGRLPHSVGKLKSDMLDILQILLSQWILKKDLT